MAHPTPDDLALIALGEEVAPEVAAHVADCRACSAEIEALQQVVAVGRSLGPDDTLAPPHPRVWDQISAQVLTRDAQVAAPRPTDASPVRDELAARRPAPRRRWAPVAAAAAAALIVGLGGGFLLRGLTSSSTAVDNATQLNALPGWPGANGTATIENGSGGERTLVVDVELPATVSVDGTMEVWMSDTRARDMVAMGTMSGDSARFPVPPGFDLATHPIVDVSLEPRNDTDPHHSDVSVVRGRLRV